MDAALDAVGLLHRASARGDELSGGEQQRVAIARVLVQEPSAVLADEPFSSLDPALREVMAGLLLGVAARGRTLVAVMHDVDFALRHFPRVVGLRRGAGGVRSPHRAGDAGAAGAALPSVRAARSLPVGTGSGPMGSTFAPCGCTSAGRPR